MAIKCRRSQAAIWSMAARTPIGLNRSICKQQISWQKHTCTQFKLRMQTALKQPESDAAEQLFSTVLDMAASPLTAATLPLLDANQDDLERDQHFMQLALQQAEIAASKQEVPVGAVIVAEDGQTLLAATHNLTHTSMNPIAHAEMLAISQASAKLSNWRLTGVTLYCTLEPCPMCAGAILQSRISRLVYGAKQPRLGADGSWLSMFPPQEAEENKVGGKRKRLRTDSSKESNDSVMASPTGEHGIACSAMSGAEACASLVSTYSDGNNNSMHRLQSGSDKPHNVAIRHPFHKQISVSRGVLEEESAELLQNFFRRRREG